MRIRFATGILAALSVAWSPAAEAADHLDAPNVMGNGQADINDLYVFQSPANPANSVLILTVNPAAGVLSPTTFGTGVTYSFNVDNSGDAIADITYSATFGAAGPGGVQSLSLTGPGGAYAAGSTGSAVSTVSGGQVQAGLFDDPFFFDLAGFQNSFTFTGTDFFAGFDTSAIVLEVPSSELGGPNIGVWATTSEGGMQVDRFGRPAINTALIGSGRKTDFNLGSPSTDFANFGAEVQAQIAALNGGDVATAMGLTSVLLPDMTTFDTSDASGFLNGRGLADDVIDAELGLLTNGAVATDGVASNDRAFLGQFPYLASANIPEPTSMALAVTVAAGLGLLHRRN